MFTSVLVLVVALSLSQVHGSPVTRLLAAVCTSTFDPGGPDPSAGDGARGSQISQLAAEVALWMANWSLGCTVLVSTAGSTSDDARTTLYFSHPLMRIRRSALLTRAEASTIIELAEHHAAGTLTPTSSWWWLVGGGSGWWQWVVGGGCWAPWYTAFDIKLNPPFFARFRERRHRSAVSLPPAPPPQCRVAWLLHRADWRTFGCAASKWGRQARCRSIRLAWAGRRRDILLTPPPIFR